MKTELIILGCGNSMGVPRIDGYWGNCSKKNKKNFRTRCSALIKKGKNSILIDTSPDIRNQLINNNIKHINSVVFSHEHADQTNGLFELRPFTFKKNGSYLSKKNLVIDIYANTKTLNLLKNRFDYCFNKDNIYPQIVRGNKIKKRFALGKGKEKVIFDTLEVNHGTVTSIAYIFNKTAYISDCNDLSIIKLKKLKKLNYLILDCLKYDKNFAHFSLEECLFINNELKPGKMILTNLHADLDYDYLKGILPSNVLPAYDGLKLKL